MWRRKRVKKRKKKRKMIRLGVMRWSATGRLLHSHWSRSAETVL